MSHLFSNCPLKTTGWFITNHATQCVVTATDEILDILGYTMPDVFGQSILQYVKLNPKLTPTPECTINTAQGVPLTFQFCLHQEPSGSLVCLDYWVMRLADEEQTGLIKPSVIATNAYGTMAQVLNIHFKQPNEELVGRPIMTFVYHEDVQELCRHLSNVLKNIPGDPLRVRWSQSPSLMEMDEEQSLNYNWMSFTFISCNNDPICIARPLKCESCQAQDQAKDSLVHDLYLYVKQCVNLSRVYMKEYVEYVLGYLVNQDNLICNFIKSNRFTKRSVGLLEFISLLLD